MNSPTVHFSDFFKSLYYSNTYLPPVDLSEDAISKDLLETEEPETAEQIQNLLSDEEVRSVFSTRLSYTPEKIQENNSILEKHGFKLLSTKPLLGVDGQQTITPFYSVIEHDEVEGWVIKSGAPRIPKDQFLLGPMNDKGEMAFFTEEESLLRIEMAKRIQKVALEANIDVVIPKKRLVAYAKKEGTEDTKEVTEKYFVVCEKIDVLSVKDTVKAIKDMSKEKQIELAKKISTIVKRAGLVDTSFDNIRLTSKGELAFLDTEPAGLMVAKKPGMWDSFFGPRGASVEKCARIGLFNLMHQTSKGPRGETNLMMGGLDQLKVVRGLEGFREQVEKEYKEVSTPKFSKWKIALSIVSLGLIALINVIVVLVKMRFARQVTEKIQKLALEFVKQQTKYFAENGPKINNDSINFFSFDIEKLKENLNTVEKQQELMQKFQKEQFFIDFQKQSAHLAKQLFAYVEGVPCTTA